MRDLLNFLGYNGDEYSAHSPRRGMATHSADIGIPEPDIQLSGGWQSSQSMRLYIDRQPHQYQRIANRLLK